MKLALFVLIGPFYLFLKNFSDTRKFILICWRSEEEDPIERERLSSNLLRQTLPIEKVDLERVFTTIEKINKERLRHKEEAPLPTHPFYEISKIYKSEHYKPVTS